MMRSGHLDRLEAAHARFNAHKTVSTAVPSAFQQRNFGALVATRDAHRRDSYYNRVLGLRTTSVVDIDTAVQWIVDTNGSQSVRVDLPIGHGLQAELTHRAFGHRDTLVWLARAGEAQPVASQALAVRSLTVADHASLRDLLTEHGPIDDEVWTDRRRLYCTDTFRWFGVFRGDTLASAASLWIYDGVGILGSALTRLEHRNQGMHTALLQARIADHHGPLYVDVDPSTTSHHNCERAGFVHVETREVWTS